MKHLLVLSQLPAWIALPIMTTSGGSVSCDALELHKRILVRTEVGNDRLLFHILNCHVPDICKCESLLDSLCDGLS